MASLYSFTVARCTGSLLVDLSFVLCLCNRCLCSRERRRPLWSYEEITSRVVAIKSAEHLEALLSRVMGVVSDIPGPGLSERWAKEALRWATYCSSRHYAGRSFQVRAWTVNLLWCFVQSGYCVLPLSFIFPRRTSPCKHSIPSYILLSIASSIENVGI